MVKVRRNVSLNIEIADDIKKREIQYKFNFSEFVERAYYNSFMSVDSKKKKIDEYKQYIQLLEQEIAESSMRENMLRSTLNRDESRFIEATALKLDQGYDIEAMCRAFNNTYMRDLELNEFKELINIVGTKNKRK